MTYPETAITPTLSAQEEAILSGKKTVHGTVTDRVLRLYDAIHPSDPPRVALDRAVLFTESLKETESAKVRTSHSPERSPYGGAKKAKRARP